MLATTLLLALSQAPSSPSLEPERGFADAPRAAAAVGGAVAPLDAPVDRRRLALLLPDADPDGVLARAAVEAAGLAAVGARRVTRSGWFLVELANPLAEGAVDGAVARVAARAGAALVSPVLVGGGIAGHGLADRGAHFAAATDELLVRLWPDDRAEPLAHLPAGVELLETRFAGLDGVLRLRVPTNDGAHVLAAARALEGSGRYAWVEPRVLASGTALGLPDDPLVGDQWAWENTGQDFGEGAGVPGFDMNLDQLPAITTGAASIGVLVLDSGVDDGHPDLAWTLGIDLMTSTPSGQPGSPQNVCDLHGTRVAGVIAAIANNGVGLAGVVPDCTLISARPFESLLSCDSSWTTFIGNTALALEYGAANGARVTNNSNHYGFTDASLEDKYTELEAAGVVHIGAAGNASSYGVEYPAILPTLIAVGGTDEWATSYGFTAIGDEIEFAAPAYHVRTTDVSGAPGEPGDYAIVQGTSFAAPHIAALAAALLSLDASLDQAAVRRILRAASADIVSDGADGLVGRDPVSGYGQPDARVAAEIASGARAGLAYDGGYGDTWLGGATTFEVLTHPPAAPGTFYFVLGSVTGTAGVPLLGEVLPLGLDPYFDHTFGSSNAPPLVGNLGVLDAEGRGTATLTVPAGALGPAFIDVHHAVLTVALDPLLAAERSPSAPRQSWIANVSLVDAGIAPLSIPDDDPLGVTSTLTVAGIGTVLEEIDLFTELTHTWAGEVDIVLESPAGTRVTIWLGDGSNFDNLNGVWGGYFGTFQSMGAFLGEDPNGTWRLEVSDRGAGDVGTLDGWKLGLRSS